MDVKVQEQSRKSEVDKVYVFVTGAALLIEFFLKNDPIVHTYINRERCHCCSSLSPPFLTFP